MSERKPQTKYVPLRVRFRSSPERPRREREHPLSSQSESRDMDFLVPDQKEVSEAQRRSRQIKELLRLGNLLRADLGLNEVLQQIAASIAACTGFRVLVINLINESGTHLSSVAFAGLSEADQRILREADYPLHSMLKLMQPEFCISQSYFISHEHHTEVFADKTVIVNKGKANYVPGGWHPEDALIVPLFSPREQRLLGCLSLDDPEDGRTPTLEGIEVVELFASQAAIAIDHARLFQEREAEHAALEKGVACLREDLEQLRLGDLSIHMRSSHQKLQPIVEAINAMVEEMSAIMGSMQMVTQAVDEHTRHVQHSSESLVRDATQQEQQVHQISDVVNDVAGMMHHVSERAAVLSNTAVEAVDITAEAQSAVDRAVEGMGMVREATMQSARTMKSLGESGQEINETVLAITDLTIRMHLLALNAAIEATRAGEHGQGFAVVAKEMRTLALLSAEAARKVGTYIRTIQHETTAVSQSVEQNTQQVVMQTELVTQTGVALEAISIVTDQLANLIQGIRTVAENQVQGSKVVVTAISEILRVTGDINNHMREMQQSMVHLVELTDSLRSRLSIFRLGER